MLAWSRVNGLGWLIETDRIRLGPSNTLRFTNCPYEVASPKRSPLALTRSYSSL